MNRRSFFYVPCMVTNVMKDITQPEKARTLRSEKYIKSSV